MAVYIKDRCIGNITKTTIRGVTVGYKSMLKGYEHHAMTLSAKKEWVRKHV